MKIKNAILKLEINYWLIIFVLTGRIPNLLADFDHYVRTATTYLDTPDPVTLIKHGIRLGLTAPEIAQGITYKVQWTDPVTPGIYDKHIDENVTGKKTARDVAKFTDTFNKWLHPLLDRMEGSAAINIDDRAVLRIAKKPTTYSRPIAKIDEIPEVTVTGSGRGMVTLKSRVPGKKGRPSLPATANAVEVTYAIYGKEFKAENELSPKVKKVEPVTEKDCTWVEQHTQAVFEMEVGTEFSGGTLKGWAHYIDVHNPKRAGDWSEDFSIMVP